MARSFVRMLIYFWFLLVLALILRWMYLFLICVYSWPFHMVTTQEIQNTRFELLYMVLKKIYSRLSTWHIAVLLLLLLYFCKYEVSGKNRDRRIVIILLSFPILVEAILARIATSEVVILLRMSERRRCRMIHHK